MSYKLAGYDDWKTREPDYDEIPDYVKEDAIGLFFKEGLFEEIPFLESEIVLSFIKAACTEQKIDDLMIQRFKNECVKIFEGSTESFINNYVDELRNDCGY